MVIQISIRGRRGAAGHVKNRVPGVRIETVSASLTRPALNSGKANLDPLLVLRVVQTTRFNSLWLWR
jgi:hypothetical protein